MKMYFVRLRTYYNGKLWNETTTEYSTTDEALANYEKMKRELAAKYGYHRCGCCVREGEGFADVCFTDRRTNEVIARLKAFEKNHD